MLFVWPYKDAPEFLREQLPGTEGSWIVIGEHSEQVSIIASSLNENGTHLGVTKIQSGNMYNTWIGIG